MSFGGPNAGETDVFLARYDDAGNQLWLTQFGTNGSDAPFAIGSDGGGGVMIAGETEDSLGGPHAGGRNDAFVAQFDGDGNQLWLNQFGTIEAEAVGAVAMDGAGGVMVGGGTQGSLSGSNPNPVVNDAFVTHYTIGDSCYVDCDQSTGNGVLDVFDFLCFQDSFVNGEPYACDCDTSTGNGVCDVFDFLCFQDAFVGGCP